MSGGVASRTKPTATPWYSKIVRRTLSVLDHGSVAGKTAVAGGFSDCTTVRFLRRAKDFYIGINTMKQRFTNLCTSFLRNNDNERGAISSDRKYNKLSGAGLSKIIMEVPSPLLLLALAMELKSSLRGTCIPSSHSRTGIMSCRKGLLSSGNLLQDVQQVVSLPKRKAALASKPGRGKVSHLCKNDRVRSQPWGNLGLKDTDPANSNWGVKRASMFCVMLLTSQRCWGRLRCRLDLDNYD